LSESALREIRLLRSTRIVAKTPNTNPLNITITPLTNPGYRLFERHKTMTWERLSTALLGEVSAVDPRKMTVSGCIPWRAEFASDSALEEDGFELAVRGHGASG
jgi:hypothetical protein